MGNVGVNGVATLYQTIEFCPSSKYRFSFYVGAAAPGDYGFNTTVTAYLDDMTIVPTQLTCVNAAQCNMTGAGQIGFRLVTAPDLITPPLSGIAKLSLVFLQAFTSPENPPLMDTFLDLVTMTKVS